MQPEGTSGAGSSSGDLESFVTTELARQQSEQPAPTLGADGDPEVEVSDARAAHFLERALTESRRMGAEATKSLGKRDKVRGYVVPSSHVSILSRR